MKRAFQIIALVMMAGPVVAEPSVKDIVQLELLPGWRTAQGSQMAGLKITLNSGWKTYWRAPGDAGIPPRFDWTGSTGIVGGELLWPVPDVFDLGGLRSVGYHDQVVIPIEFTLSDPQADAHLQGQVELGVCEEICVPVSLTFSAVLAADQPRNPDIVAALVDRPLTRTEAKVGSVTCQSEPIDNGLHVTVTMDLPSTGADEFVVIEAGNERVWVSEAIAARQGDMLVASADMIQFSGEPFALDRSAMRATVIGDNHAVDILGCIGG